MLEKRKKYIDQLLSDLKLLEERLLSVKESDTLPFSFFSASFDRIEKISRSLHELELMQIGEMKQQMERLVRFLSESDGKNNAVSEPEVDEKEKETESDILQGELKHSTQLEPSEQENHLNRVDQPEYPEELVSPVSEVDEIDEICVEQKSVSFAEKIILPEYRDLRIADTMVPPSVGPVQDPPERNGKERSVSPSLNDIIKAPPALLDLKRGISLNDRFLFQRELFNNNRSEMNSLIEKLNSLGSFVEAERFLKSERDWNFEDQTVKEFLLIIKKGFE